MWILFALGSAFFAGLTAVLAKCGIEHTNSHLALHYVQLWYLSSHGLW